MTVRQLVVDVITCDGCDRRLSINGHSVFAVPGEAQEVADYLGWTRHPDGTDYCPEGNHA